MRPILDLFLTIATGISIVILVGSIILAVKYFNRDVLIQRLDDECTVEKQELRQNGSGYAIVEIRYCNRAGYQSLK